MDEDEDTGRSAISGSRADLAAEDERAGGPNHEGSAIGTGSEDDEEDKDE